MLQHTGNVSTWVLNNTDLLGVSLEIGDHAAVEDSLGEVGELLDQESERGLPHLGDLAHEGGLHGQEPVVRVDDDVRNFPRITAEMRSRNL